MWEQWLVHHLIVGVQYHVGGWRPWCLGIGDPIAKKKHEDELAKRAARPEFDMKGLQFDE
jgi:hypothetical protein